MRVAVFVTVLVLAVFAVAEPLPGADAGKLTDQVTAADAGIQAAAVLASMAVLEVSAQSSACWRVDGELLADYNDPAAPEEFCDHRLGGIDGYYGGVGYGPTRWAAENAAIADAEANLPSGVEACWGVQEFAVWYTTNIQSGVPCP